MLTGMSEAEESDAFRILRSLIHSLREHSLREHSLREGHDAPWLLAPAHASPRYRVQSQAVTAVALLAQKGAGWWCGVSGW